MVAAVKVDDGGLGGSLGGVAGNIEFSSHPDGAVQSQITPVLAGVYGGPNPKSPVSCKIHGLAGKEGVRRRIFDARRTGIGDLRRALDVGGLGAENDVAGHAGIRVEPYFSRGRA